MYIPLVWWLGWIFIMYIFVPQFQNMDVNPFIVIQMSYYILITPFTWITIIIGIVGYLIHNHKG
jgi:hypothetical protein